MKFKLGDIVRLKSGSPKLVVVSVEKSNRYVGDEIDDDVTVVWIVYGSGIVQVYTGPSVVFVHY